MSFADPQSVTLSGTANSLPRVSSGANAGTFALTNDYATLALEVSHSYGKRTRRTIQLRQTKLSADPLIPAQNINPAMRVYMVVDAPSHGFTATEQKALVDALTAYLTASSGAKVTQLLGGEN